MAEGPRVGAGSPEAEQVAGGSEEAELQAYGEGSGEGQGRMGRAGEGTDAAAVQSRFLSSHPSCVQTSDCEARCGMDSGWPPRGGKSKETLTSACRPRGGQCPGVGFPSAPTTGDRPARLAFSEDGPFR